MAANLRDIAREVGVSVTTVSRALNGYSDVSAETRDRIHHAARRLSYSPNLAARRLKKQRTDTLGFIMPTVGPRFSDPFFSAFIAGVGNEAAAQHYDLLVSTHAPDSDEEMRAYTRAAAGGWVDGVIVVRTRENDSRIRYLVERGFPFVAFGRTSNGFDYPYIDEDGIAGMSLLTQHFIDLGHRRIGFIAALPGLMFGRYRQTGFEETMARNGLAPQPAQIVAGDMTRYGGQAAMETLLDTVPDLTAVIACNDLMAMGAMALLQARGYTVGQDIAVGGFDDIPMASMAATPLTTLRQPIYHIGRKTCAMLIDLLADGPDPVPHILLKPELIVRASSGPVRAAL